MRIRSRFQLIAVAAALITSYPDEQRWALTSNLPSQPGSTENNQQTLPSDDRHGAPSPDPLANVQQIALPAKMSPSTVNSDYDETVSLKQKEKARTRRKTKK